MEAIEVRGLRKEYGAVVAVDSLDLRVHRGEVFALLGPNGAGKTTTVEILEGHRRATSGHVRVLGYDPQSGGRALRERLGIVLQDAGFEEQFTVTELVRLHGRTYPRRFDTSELIDLVGLGSKADARVRTLSGGQRRRLDLALGLVGVPELLFLDEPTTGFDPAARRVAWHVVEQLRDAGTTVLLTTHDMDEAAHLADRVAVMVHGRLVALGTPAELSAGRSAAVVTFRLPPDAVLGDLPPVDGGIEADGLDLRLTTTRPTAALHALTGWALGRGVEMPSLDVRTPSLEDVYLGLVGPPDAQADDPVPTR